VLYVASRGKSLTDVISVTNFDDKFDAMKNKQEPADAQEQ